MLLVDLVDPALVPRDLFAPPASARPKALMAALDRINEWFGREAAGFGLADPAAPWRMRQQARSPAYTTSWKDLSVARA